MDQKRSPDYRGHQGRTDWNENRRGKQVKRRREEVNERGAGQAQEPGHGIAGALKKKSQDSEMELLFQTMTKQSFLEIKEGLNLLYLFTLGNSDQE